MAIASQKKIKAIGARDAEIQLALRAIEIPFELQAIVCAYAAPALRILPQRHSGASRAPEAGEVDVDLHMSLYRVNASARIHATNATFGAEDQDFVIKGVTTDVTLEQLLTVIRSTPLTRNSFAGRLADAAVAGAVEPPPVFPMTSGVELIAGVFGAAAAAHLAVDLARFNCGIDAERWTRALVAACGGNNRVHVKVRILREYFALNGRAKYALYSWQQMGAWFASGTVPTWPTSSAHSAFENGEEERYLALSEYDPTFSALLLTSSFV